MEGVAQICPQVGDLSVHRWGAQVVLAVLGDSWACVLAEVGLPPSPGSGWRPRPLSQDN